MSINTNNLLQTSSNTYNLLSSDNIYVVKNIQLTVKSEHYVIEETSIMPNSVINNIKNTLWFIHITDTNTPFVPVNMENVL